MMNTVVKVCRDIYMYIIGSYNVKEDEKHIEDGSHHKVLNDDFMSETDSSHKE